jgi:hypothetical protein
MDAWFTNAKLADSTRVVRKHIIDRDVLPVFQNRLLTEIQPKELRALFNKVKERGAPATAVQIRDIVKQVYVYAIAHDEKVDNPANSVGAALIATFVPKDRALSPLENPAACSTAFWVPGVYGGVAASLRSSAQSPALARALPESGRIGSKPIKSGLIWLYKYSFHAMMWSRQRFDRLMEAET